MSPSKLTKAALDRIIDDVHSLLLFSAFFWRVFTSQTPYFWPSQNHNPDNTEYTIYLYKRSLRNRQKHGLEDYEVVRFTNGTALSSRERGVREVDRPGVKRVLYRNRAGGAVGEGGLNVYVHKTWGNNKI